MSKKSIRKYFRDWDPMRFIAEGAPKDEYDVEADEVEHRFRSEMSNEELGNLIHDIFLEYMEIDPDNLKQDCMDRASDIRKSLS